MANVNVFVNPTSVNGGNIQNYGELYNTYQDHKREDYSRRNYQAGFRPSQIVAYLSFDFRDHGPQYSARLQVFRQEDNESVLNLEAVVFYLGKLNDLPNYQNSLWNPIAIYRLEEFPEIFGEIVILLREREGYYILAKCLGREMALKLLTSANDIAALNFQSVKKGLLERAMHESSLARYLQVDNEAFINFMSLGRMYEKQSIGLGPAPSEIGFVFQDTESSEVDFQFDFGRQVKGVQRINAIIGANGVGKTRALLALANHVTSTKQKWPSRALLYTHDAGIVRGRLLSRVKTVNLSPTRQNWLELSKRLVYLMVADGVNSRKYELLDRLLSEVLPLRNIYFAINRNAYVPDQLKNSAIIFNSESYISFADVPQGEAAAALMFRMDMPPMVRTVGDSLVYPSSGEMSLFLFLTSVLVECSEGSLLLIDEPENHLHPQFISLLMRNLSRILIDTDSLAVVATHSPFVIRELDKSGVTIMMKATDGGADLFAPTLQTHGADVSEISEYVFDDRHIRKGYENVIDSMLETRGLTPTEAAEFVGENFGGDGVSYFLKKNYAS
jgi:predicted ATPase